MSVLLLGSSGQLGSDIKKSLISKGIRPLCPKRSDMDICEISQVRTYLTTHKNVKLIINSAAFIDVEESELKPQEAFKVNSEAVLNISIEAHNRDMKLMHISTNYVFDGKSNTPYVEGDVPNPINAYGSSKYIGEMYIKWIYKNKDLDYSIIRTSGLFGSHSPKGKYGNFVDLIVNKVKSGESISIKRDEFISPTYTVDLGEKIADFSDKLINSNGIVSGIYHVVNNSQISWFEFAELIAQKIGGDLNLIKPIKSNEFISHAPRPLAGCMMSTRVENMPFLEDALTRYMEEKYGIK
jgi:dTDP-4-dehydrorhamnose reductase